MTYGETKKSCFSLSDAVEAFNDSPDGSSVEIKFLTPGEYVLDKELDVPSGKTLSLKMADDYISEEGSGPDAPYVVLENSVKVESGGTLNLTEIVLMTSMEPTDEPPEKLIDISISGKLNLNQADILGYTARLTMGSDADITSYDNSTIIVAAVQATGIETLADLQDKGYLFVAMDDFENEEFHYLTEAELQKSSYTGIVMIASSPIKVISPADEARTLEIAEGKTCDLSVEVTSDLLPPDAISQYIQPNWYDKNNQQIEDSEGLSYTVPDTLDPGTYTFYCGVTCPMAGDFILKSKPFTVTVTPCEHQMGTDGKCTECGKAVSVEIYVDGATTPAAYGTSLSGALAYANTAFESGNTSVELKLTDPNKTYVLNTELNVPTNKNLSVYVDGARLELEASIKVDGTLELTNIEIGSSKQTEISINGELKMINSNIQSLTTGMTIASGDSINIVDENGYIIVAGLEITGGGKLADLRDKGYVLVEINEDWEYAHWLNEEDLSASGYTKCLGIDSAPVKVEAAVTGPTPDANALTYGYTEEAALQLTATAEPSDWKEEEISYQWYKNGTAIKGATSKSYTVETGLAPGNYEYYCTVSCIVLEAVDGTLYTANSAPVKVTVNKAPLEITGAELEAKIYNGNKDAVVKSVTLTGIANGETLTMGVDGDYTATAQFDNENAGEDKTATVTVKMLNSNYSFADGAEEATYQLKGQEISRQELSGVTVTFEKTSYVWDNDKAIEPPVTVSAEGVNLTEGDYTVAYSSNTGLGKGKVTVTGSKNYTFTATAEFDITCPHLSFDRDHGRCEKCGEQATAGISTIDIGTSGALSDPVYYFSINEAWEAAQKCTGKRVSFQLYKSAAVTEPLVMDNESIEIRLTPFGASSPTGITLTGECDIFDVRAGTLPIGDNISVTSTGGNAITASGGSVEIDGNGKFTGVCGLSLSGTATAKLRGGTFSGIETTVEGQTVGNLLDKDSAYKTSAGWLVDDALKESSITAEVSVQMAPVQINDQTKTENVEPLTYGYESEPTLLVEVRSAGDFAYQWYLVSADGNDVPFNRGSGFNTDTLTLPTGMSTGEYQFYCAVTLDGYTAKSVPVTVTVNKAPLGITGAALKEKTYDGEKGVAVDSVAFDGLVNGDTLTIGEDGDYTATVEFADENAGTVKDATVTVTLKDSVTNNYTLADNTFVLHNQEIKKADEDIARTVSETAWTQTGGTFTLTCSASFSEANPNGRTVEFSKDGQSWDDTLEITGVQPGASVTVHHRLKETSNYNAGPDDVAAVTAPKLSSELTVNMDSWTYGEAGKAPQIIWDLESDGKQTIEYKAKDAEDSAYTTTKPTNAGSYVVRVSYTETDRFNQLTGTADFSIKKRKLTPVINGTLSKVYDNTTTPPTDAEVLMQGGVDGDRIEFVADISFDAPNAGDRKLTAKNIRLDEGTALNYELTTDTAECDAKIEKAPVTLTIDNQAITYGEKPQNAVADPDLDITYSYTDNADSTKTGSGWPVDVGTYTVTASVAETENYEGASKDITLTISAKTVAATVTVDPTSYVYTGTTITPTTVTVKDGTTTIPTGEYTISYDSNTDVGKATATVKDKEGGNYDFNDATAEFQIVAADINSAEVKVDGSYTYNGSVQTPEPTVTLGGKALVKGVDYTVSYTGNVNVGTDRHGQLYRHSGDQFHHRKGRPERSRQRHRQRGIWSQVVRTDGYGPDRQAGGCTCFRHMDAHRRYNSERRRYQHLHRHLCAN